MKRSAGRNRGFSVTELLVVIGIIILLMGIAFPAINYARKQANLKSIKLDLQAISMALEQYKQDFRDYPRPPGAGVGRQQKVLAWALLAPFPATTGATTSVPGGNLLLMDGADGPGFRTQYNPATGKGGKVWGPYLPPEKFKLAANQVDILDRFDRTIEYLPRWRDLAPDPTNITRSIPLLTGYSVTPGATVTTVYDANQVLSIDAGNAAIAIRKLLGDTNNDNQITYASETAKTAPPFLLMSKGLYPKDFSQAVTNLPE